MKIRVDVQLIRIRAVGLERAYNRGSRGRKSSLSLESTLRSHRENIDMANPQVAA